jgi:hypothetical protein
VADRRQAHRRRRDAAPPLLGPLPPQSGSPHIAVARLPSPHRRTAGGPEHALHAPAHPRARRPNLGSNPQPTLILVVLALGILLGILFSCLLYWYLVDQLVNWTEDGKKGQHRIILQKTKNRGC